MTARHDPGLQSERTELAWRRTLLALAVGALVAVRVLPPVLGRWAIVIGGGGVLVSALLWVLAHRRARAVGAALRGPSPASGPRPSAMPGAALLLAVTLLTATGAALGLLTVLLPHR